MMENSLDLLQLAQDKSLNGRAKLAHQTAIQLLSQSRDFTDTELKYFGDIFSLLYDYLDENTKKMLASAVALSDWAPKSLLQAIALDKSEIAGPVVSHNNKIDDLDLENIVLNGSRDHQMRVAQRPFIGEIVSDALVNVNEFEIVAALSKNQTAAISEDTMKKAIEISKGEVSIIDNFVQRSDISKTLIELAKSLGSQVAMHKNKSENAVHLSIETLENAFNQAISETQEEEEENIDFNPQQAFYDLARGNKEGFYSQTSIFFEVDKKQILKLLNLEKIENFALICLAIGFDASKVAPIIKALGFAHIWRPEYKIGIDALWTRYNADEAKIQILRALKSIG
jgi:Uncharacterised protein conserved in bacteria (DUF2336)